jgi:carbonic anhydrase/acetyltransferase-like protein (isoleucine patch superfamily)
MAIYRLGSVSPQIDATAFVHPDATVIGNVVLGPLVSVWPQAVIRGDFGRIEVGARSCIQDGSVIHADAFCPTIIGDDCVVGHLVHLEGCTLRNGSMAGSGSTVLHNVVVGEGAIVAANALCKDTTIVPAGALAVGVPAIIKEGAAKPEIIALAAAGYLENAKRYRSELVRLD